LRISFLAPQIGCGDSGEVEAGSDEFRVRKVGSTAQVLPDGLASFGVDVVVDGELARAHLDTLVI